MTRFSVSFDEELTEWIEQQAAERDIPKAQVIREAVRSARDQPGVDPVETDVRRRLEAIETRVNRLESFHTDESPETADDEATAENPPSDQADIVAQFADYIEQRPPDSDAAKAATVTTFRILRERGAMPTREIREAVYEEHPDSYSDAKSLWQSIQRYFDELPGIEQTGYGEWGYAGDESVQRVLTGLDR